MDLSSGSRRHPVASPALSRALPMNSTRPTPAAALTALPRAASLLALASFAALSSPSVHAQAAPASPPDRPSTDATVMSPFEVNTSKDQGFVATSALAGGRLNTPLKDTPVAYSVLTREFLEAFNINDLTEAVQWSVNTTFNPGNFTDQGFGFSPAI